jgi:hypothetical protein
MLNRDDSNNCYGMSTLRDDMPPMARLGFALEFARP